jgi:uncharacterized phage protein (TIGR01671 family)
MREIKFRAWESTRSWNRMFEVESIGWEQGEIISIEGYSKKEGACSWYQEDDGDIILMQFTSLHDKKGKGSEIYHKDILKVGEGYVGDHRERGGNFLVDWGEDEWIVVDSKGEYLCDLWTAIYNRNAEIIGNIYENPELLGENHA